MANFNAVLARNAENVAPSICGFSHTVAFSHYNNLSAQLPVDADGKIVSKNIKEQAIQCFENIKAIVKNIKHSLDDVVKLTVFTKSAKDLNVVIDVLKTYFKKYKPAITLLVVKNIPLNALVQIEAVITCGEGTIPGAPQAGDLVKVACNTTLAPQNDYSTQTVAFSHYNHISAQYGIDPKSKKLVSTKFEEQFIQSLKNIKTILESIDVPFDDIVKVNVYTTSLKETDKIKAIYKTFFPDSAIARAYNYLPALAINEVVDLPQSAKVAVDITVSHGDGTPPQLVEDRHGIVIKFNNTTAAPMCCSSSQTVMFSHYNNISEILPIDPKSKKVVSKNIEDQFKACLDYLKKIVKSVKHSIDDVVKLNIYVEDIKKIDEFTPILKKYFTKSLPAGRIIEVGTIGADAKVKIDAIVSNAEGTSPEWKKSC